MKYKITKRYDHNEGLSCAFRQWRAPDTHCSKIHGYALAVELTFEGDTLNEKNWLISFGELKEVKQYLKDQFDHKTLISKHDPELQWFIDANVAGILQLEIVDEVGCEKFAELVYTNVIDILGDKMDSNNVFLTSVTIAEHSGNSATYSPPLKPRATDVELCDKGLTNLFTDLWVQPRTSAAIGEVMINADSYIGGKFVESFGSIFGSPLTAATGR